VTSEKQTYGIKMGRGMISSMGKRSNSPVRGSIFIASVDSLTAESREGRNSGGKRPVPGQIGDVRMGPAMRSMSAESATYHSPGQRPGIGAHSFTSGSCWEWIRSEK